MSSTPSPQQCHAQRPSLRQERTQTLPQASQQSTPSAPCTQAQTISASAERNTDNSSQPVPLRREISLLTTPFQSTSHRLHAASALRERLKAAFAPAGAVTYVSARLIMSCERIASSFEHFLTRVDRSFISLCVCVCVCLSVCVCVSVQGVSCVACGVCVMCFGGGADDVI